MKLLSILVSLAMLFSVCCVAETPETPASGTVVIHDAVATIDGAEYPLNPSIVFGAASRDGAALIDFGMPLGEDVLFPVQVKIDESGLGLLLGESDTVYTLTPAFFQEMLDGAEMPDEFTSLFQSYGDLMSTTLDMDQDALLEQQLAIGEKFMELIGDAPTEEATFHANGQDQTGQHVAFTLTNDQMAEYLEYCYSLMPSDYTEAYFSYLNSLLSAADMPEVDSFGDVFAITGMEMSVDGDMIYNETSGVADLVFHATVQPDAASTGESAAEIEPVSFDMPMEITVHTPENMEYVINMDVEGVKMVITSTLVDGSQSASVTMSDGEMVDMTMDMTLQPQESGSAHVDFDMTIDVDSAVVSIAVESVPNDAGSSTACEFSYSEEGFSCGAALTIDVTGDAVADRTAGKTVAEINSSDELESNPGLLMAAMSLVGGVEKLINDDSVAALIEAVQSYVVIHDTVGAEPIEETIAIADNTESAAPMPEFGWLPEGYVVTESMVQPDGSYSTFYLEKDLGDGNYSIIYIDMAANLYSAPSSTVSYALSGDGAQPIDGTVVTIDRLEDGSTSAYITMDNTEIWLNCFDGELTDEDIIQLFSGITFPESAA